MYIRIFPQLQNVPFTNGDYVHCRTPLPQTAIMYTAKRHLHKRRLCTLQNTTSTNGAMYTAKRHLHKRRLCTLQNATSTAERHFHKRRLCTLQNATSTNGNYVHCRTSLPQTATMNTAKRHFHKRRLCTLQNAISTNGDYISMFSYQSCYYAYRNANDWWHCACKQKFLIVFWFGDTNRVKCNMYFFNYVLRCTMDMDIRIEAKANVVEFILYFLNYFCCILFIMFHFFINPKP